MHISWLLCLALVLFSASVWCMEESDGATETATGDNQGVPDPASGSDPASGADSGTQDVDALAQIADLYAQHLYRVFDAAYGQIRRGFGQVVRDIRQECSCDAPAKTPDFIPPSARAPPPRSARPQYKQGEQRPVVSNNASPPL